MDCCTRRISPVPWQAEQREVDVPGCAPAAATGRTGLPARQFDLFLAAKDGLLKGNSQIVAKIRASLRPGAPLRTRSLPAKKVSKMIVDTAKAGEVAKAGARAVAKSGMTIAIIGGTLLRVAQHLIASLISIKRASAPCSLLVSG